MNGDNIDNFIFGERMDDVEDFRIGRLDDERRVEAAVAGDQFNRFRFRCNDLRCFNRCRERAIENCYKRCCRRNRYY